MAVPISQALTVATHVLKQKLKRNRRYPLVLMLEPLLRCNLACAGCGKIQYPAHVLKRQLSPDECFRAAEECGAPIVSIPGGEPLMHPQIDQIVRGLIERKKYVYLCTNALLMKEKLDLFTPNKRLTFSVHLDGTRDAHDFAVCREGTFDRAIEAIREAVQRGFRVTTNTTLFDGASPKQCREFFDLAMDLNVEGMMISPGYHYDRAPDQQHFLGRKKSRQLFRKILSNRSKRWKFNQSPLFLEFLMGRREYSCTPWGMPTYNVFGWQKPCYLLQDGYAKTFDELMRTTRWQDYGWESGNPRCADCMVHSGYEASAVAETFASPRGLLATIRAMLFHRYADPAAAEELERDQTVPAHVVHLTVNGESQSAEPDEPPSLHGKIASADDELALRRSAREAFEYRGDVTLILRDGRQIQGYVSDFEDCNLRVLPDDSSPPIMMPLAEISRIEFSGKDTASGKSFKTWLTAYRRRASGLLSADADAHNATAP